MVLEKSLKEHFQQEMGAARIEEIDPDTLAEIMDSFPEDQQEKARDPNFRRERGLIDFALMGLPEQLTEQDVTKKLLDYYLSRGFKYSEELKAVGMHLFRRDKRELIATLDYDPEEDYVLVIVMENKNQREN